MRADYATSDLISKVNSEWINKVLVDIDRTGPQDDDVPDDRVGGDPVSGNHFSQNELTRNELIGSDHRLRREFARKRATLLERGATSNGRHEPDIAIDPTRRYRRRSVARRIKERLALAVVALAVVGAAAWMAPEPQDAMSSASTRAASAAPEPAAPIDTAELQPAWLVPEILYGPAMAHSPVSPAEASRPAPRPGH
jgi:hypothetical protein